LFSHQVEKLDWSPWNDALVKLWAVAPDGARDAAKKIDSHFWTCRYRIEHQNIREKDWKAERDEIEAARVEFINVFRGEVVGIGPVADGPVARPPVSELRARYPGTGENATAPDMT
jgi:hypothetical protein